MSRAELKINRYDHGGARIFFERDDGTRDLVVDIYDNEPGVRREVIIKTLIDAGVLIPENARQAAHQNDRGKGKEGQEDRPAAGEVVIRSSVSVNDQRALVKAIAMDIGKEVVAYVEVQYPKAIDHTSSTFKLSLRNCIYNEIMAAIDVTDEGQIIARLRDRKTFRRKWTAAWRKIRNRSEASGPST